MFFQDEVVLEAKKIMGMIIGGVLIFTVGVLVGVLLTCLAQAGRTGDEISEKIEER